MDIFDATVMVARPVSRRISRRPKIFGLAAIDFAKPPAAGRKKIRLSRRFCHRLSRDHNDLHGVKVVINYTAVHSIENYNENYYVQCSQQLRRTADEKFKIEAESYLPFTLCEEKQSAQNPLLFWRDHRNNFPTLQVLAGLSLGMSAAWQVRWQWRAS